MDAETQTRLLLERLAGTLTTVGSGPDYLIDVTFYLVDINHYDAVTAVWEAWVPRGTAPVRHCVQVSALSDPRCVVEAVARAALKPCRSISHFIHV